MIPEEEVEMKAVHTFRGVSNAAAAVSLVLIVALSSSMLSAGDKYGKDTEITLSFKIEEGKILKYKGKNTEEFNYAGNDINRIHTDEITLSLIDRLEDGNVRVALTYDECSDKMLMSGNLREYQSPIKPEGKTVKIVLDPKGKLVDVQGFVMGVPKGKQLEDYVDKWFVELPEEEIKIGTKWTKEIDESPETGEGEEADEDVIGFSVKGTIHLELKKYEEVDGIDVAVIEYKGELVVHQASAMGELNGKAEVKGKVKVSIEAGWLVEKEETVEFKGKAVGQDPSTGKEVENDIYRTDYFEAKLHE